MLDLRLHLFPVLLGNREHVSGKIHSMNLDSIAKKMKDILISSAFRS
jgi:hypothetical protein